MARQDLVDYVNYCREQGYSDAQIKRYLQGLGHSEADISAALGGNSYMLLYLIIGLCALVLIGALWYMSQPSAEITRRTIEPATTEIEAGLGVEAEPEPVQQPIGQCEAPWRCGPWVPRVCENGTQARTCVCPCEDDSLCTGDGSLTRSCDVPSCDDGIRNQDEAGVDCGGSCDPCETCADGIQNQDEEGVDCGGGCMACPSANETSTTQEDPGTEDGQRSRIHGIYLELNHLEAARYELRGTPYDAIEDPLPLVDVTFSQNGTDYTQGYEDHREGYATVEIDVADYANATELRFCAHANDFEQCFDGTVLYDNATGRNNFTALAD